MILRKPINLNSWGMVLALWVPLIFTLMLAVVAFRGQNARDLDSRWVLHTVEAKVQLERLSSLVKDVETSQRGFLLTADPVYLSPYHHAINEISGRADTLAAQIADNPNQVAAANRLRFLIENRLAIAARSLDLVKQNSVDGAQALREGEGKKVMDDIRSQVASMIEEEDRLLTKRKQAFQGDADRQTLLMTVLVVVDVALIVGLTLLIRHSQKSQQTAEEQTAHANTRTDQAEVRTEQANTLTDQADVRTVLANARTDQADVRTEEANARTERAEARSVDATLASELRYRRLFETAQDGILILDAESGQVMDANPFMKDLLGYSQEEFLGRKLWEIGPFKGEAASKIAFAELQLKDCLRYEGLPLETKNGLTVEVEFISIAFLVGEKRLIQCNIRDITERKKTEQRMILLNACIANLNDIVLIVDAEQVDESGPKIVFVNRAFERITGYTSTQALSQSPRFLQGAHTDPQTVVQIQEALVQQQSIRIQVIIYDIHGSEFWLDCDIVPILNPIGKCTHFAAIARDITEAKKNEAQLLWRTAFFEAQINSALDGILVVDNEGRKILQNLRMVNLWAIPRELIGDFNDGTPLDWVITQTKNPREFSGKVAYLHDHPDEIGRDEIDLLDGRCFDRYSAPVRGTDGKDYGRIWAFRDITDRKLAESRFRQLVDSNAQGVMFWNTQGGVTGCNDAFLTVTGYAQEDVDSGRVNWLAMTPGEYRRLDLIALEELAAKGVSTPFEKEFIRKDGTRIAVLLSAATFEDNPQEGVCFIVDLTERKKLEHQFLRAQRMESIGTLAGGIAHDLNNILAPILMSIQLLKLNTNDPESETILNTIEACTKRGADIVRQVLSFARGMEGVRIEVQLEALLKDLENIIKDTFPKNIGLSFNHFPGLWTILADPTQVHQVLLNLTVNARDAMPDGGILTVGVENCVLDENYITTHVGARTGRHIKIEITDSGSGIPAHVIDKIFEPFFTTKELNEGTGLGLSTVMAIMKSHHGTVNVYSEPGRGTTFQVYFPASDVLAVEGSQPLDEVGCPHGKGETILVVDDEAAIRTVAARTLEAYGYRTLTAEDGVEALTVFTQHRKDIDLILIDMMMPEMDGASAIRVLTRMEPTIRIIAASGLTSHGGAARASRAKVKHFLSKPYTAGALLKAVRASLDEV